MRVHDIVTAMVIQRKAVRRMLTVAAGVTVALTGTLVTASPAAAVSVGCGSACEGKDAGSYRASVNGVTGLCSHDAVTIYVKYGAELRYSPWCRTAWSRSEDPGYLGYTTVESYNSSGRRKVYSAENRSYSLMVNDKGYTARACKYEWPSEDEYNRGDPAKKIGCNAKY